ncbi:hypothetical protein AM587_10007486 [Phytophthora nicotianae]|uniref:Uncharacterized protein n=2 Tax=Phytophthora nicotianae TaxID=4792 RepID=A0A0W8C7K0_PHYNI|nr:hypothetical protein AM587_10007486 [Phytophthora nicotianae]
MYTNTRSFRLLSLPTAGTASFLPVLECAHSSFFRFRGSSLLMPLKSIDNVNRKCGDAKHDTKKVKPTQVKAETAYAIRKERKRLLMEQADTMQDKLDKLKFRLLVKQGHIEKDTKRTVVENAVLHEYIQEQHVTIATTQAALTGHVHRSLGAQMPAQSVIRLGMDRQERFNTLMALKDRKVYEAERYLVARTQGIENRMKYCQEERFETIGGDNCIVRFETAPIHGASVKAVFDALLNTVLNSEMFLSELFGSITIREDSDFENSEFAQWSRTLLCFRSWLGENGEYGIMAEDFVDFDELHPYRDSERVRRDTTTIVMVRALPQTNGGSPVIVVTRWTYLKIHNSSLGVSQNPDTELMESSVCWGDTAQKCMEQQLMNAARFNSP